MVSCFFLDFMLMNNLCFFFSFQSTTPMDSPEILMQSKIDIVRLDFIRFKVKLLRIKIKV